MEEPKKLSEVRVMLQRLQPDEHAVVLEYPDNLGKRTKLGGIPDWLQSDETPGCPTCHRSMRFVAQIDSIDFIDTDPPNVAMYGTEAYMFGDVGLLYVFSASLVVRQKVGSPSLSVKPISSLALRCARMEAPSRRFSLDHGK